MKKIIYLVAILSMTLLGSVALAQVEVDGFLQTLYGARLNDNNPTATEYTASETRLQTRLQHFGDNTEFFGRLDFVYDAADSSDYDWELREGYLKFRVGSKLDFKVGRQIITWGTGDLIFINDVFAKDYRSFFIGRDDQYLKAPQNALRMEYYSGYGSFTLILTPRFEPNRLPTGRRLSYYNPFVSNIVGEGFFFDPPTPESKIENGEVAARFSRRMGNFNTSLYAYRGFYKNPLGAEPVTGSPGMFTAVYPRLNVYGASIRGSMWGGILWLETGYFDSRDDKENSNPLMPNSSITGLAGFEKQVASNLTANLQYQVTQTEDDEISGVQTNENETHHLLTSRITKLLYDELISLSTFVFYSPSDEDAYFRLAISYQYSDELALSAGANIFIGSDIDTDFGQFQLNDNAYLKLTYGF